MLGVLDSRRQRSKREISVNTVREVLGRMSEMLIGLKPAITSMPDVILVLNDGLDVIEQAKQEIKNL